MLPIMGNYSASWLVEFFHIWPHISFNLVLLKPNEYNFTNSAYLESLAVIALMAITWLLFTMMGFAIYFCCLKAKRKTDSKYSSSGCYCSVCVLTVFLMLNLAGIGVALYGNMQTGDGVKIVTASVKVGMDAFLFINTKVTDMSTSAEVTMGSIAELKESLPNETNVIKIEENTEKIVDAINALDVPLETIESGLEWSYDLLLKTEQYRSLGTFCLLGFQCLICFLGLIGLCCKSKCTLIVTIVLGMFCITATYFYLGVDLMMSVASADHCIAPYAATYNGTVNNNLLSDKVAKYFIKCETESEHPYSSEVENARLLLQKNAMFMKSIEQENITKEQQETLYKLETDVESFSSSLDSFDTSLECKMTKQAIDRMVLSICGSSLEGLFALAASMFGIGFCMTFVLCAAAKTGKRYGKNIYGGDSDLDLNYSDPFLPQPTRYSSGSNRNLNITRTNNPIYATTASSNSNYGVATNTLSFFRQGSDEDVSLLENPPPYSPPRPT